MRNLGTQTEFGGVGFVSGPEKLFKVGLRGLRGPIDIWRFNCRLQRAVFDCIAKRSVELGQQANFQRKQGRPLISGSFIHRAGMEFLLQVTV